MPLPLPLPLPVTATVQAMAGIWMAPFPWRGIRRPAMNIRPFALASARHAPRCLLLACVSAINLITPPHRWPHKALFHRTPVAMPTGLCAARCWSRQMNTARWWVMAIWKGMALWTISIAILIGQAGASPPRSMPHCKETGQLRRTYRLSGAASNGARRPL